MMTKTRGTRNARLGCEVLEDRVNPAVAYALTGVTAGAGNLIAFDTATPTVTTTVTLTGITAGETLVGLDFRPQNGNLYALGVNGTNGTLYNISARTGTTTVVGTAGGIIVPGVNLTAGGYGFDFNPMADRIRVVFGSESFRVDPNTGLFVASDGDINIGGAAATIDGSAYSNNVPNAGSFTLFGIDSATDALYTQATTTGTLTLVGTNLGVAFDTLNGFDIAASGAAFAALSVGATTNLYSINLTTGTASLVGAIGNGAVVSGFAVASDVAGMPAIALNAAGTNLLRFNTTTPGTVTTSAAISGLTGTDVLVGIDFRPNTGQLFGLGVPAAGGTGTLYLIDPQTAVATPLGALTGGPALPAPSGASGYGMSFNPIANGGLSAIRVTTTTGLNFRINPDTRAVTSDPNTNGSTSTGLSAVSYTNNFAPGAAGATTLYTIDATLDVLFIQNPPNSGTQSAGKPITVNGTQINFTEVNAFDIPSGVQVGTSNAAANGFGYAVLTVGGTASLYQIDLMTGAATNLGAVAVGAGTASGLALGDSSGGTVSFQSATVTGNEGTSGINVVLTRTGGTGPQVVTVNVTGGTATAGTDFTGGPYTVVFADGATTATLNIPFVNDSTAEGPETVNLSITAVSNGLIGAQSITTVTANDTAQIFGQVFAASAGQTLVAVLPTGATQPTVFNPYADMSIAGGVRVAVGDINNDGVNDLVTINAVGAPLVRVFSGANGTLLTSFQAYPTTINIPASLAVGDINNDGFDDIVLSTTTTIGAVIAFSGKDFSQIGLFLPGGGIPVGFNVSVGDTNGDGFEDIVLGTVTGLSAVAVFSGKDFSLQSVFLPFGGLALGTNMATGDLDGDGLMDLVVGTNSTVPAVLIFNGKNPTTQPTVFFPFGAIGGGASVAVSDVNGDGKLDIIVGTTSGASTSIAFDGRTLAPLNTFSPFGGFNGGITVA